VYASALDLNVTDDFCLSGRMQILVLRKQ